MGCNCDGNGNGNGRASVGHTGRANGQTIELFAKQEFSFNDVDTNKALEYKMVKALDVIDFSAAMLVVRVHSVTIANSAKIEVYVQSTAPSCEEPNTEFVGADILANVQVDASSSAGSSVTATIDGAYGVALRICVKGTQDPSTQGNCTATLSASLVARRSTGAQTWASTLVHGATSGGTAALVTEGDHLGWQDNQSTPITRWLARNAPADDDWELARLDSGGSETDIPMTATADNGDVLLANRLGIGGEHFGDALVDADDLVIGSISTALTGLSVLTTQWGELAFTNASATRKVSLWANCTTPYLSFYVGAERFRMEGNAFHGVTTNARDLGKTSVNWRDVYISGDVISHTTSKGLKAADQSSGDGIVLRIEGSAGQSDAGDGGLIVIAPEGGANASSSDTKGGDAGAFTVGAAGNGGNGNGTGAGGDAGAFNWEPGDGGTGGATGAGGTGGGLTHQGGDGGAGGSTSGNGGDGGLASYAGGDGGDAATEGVGGAGGSAFLTAGDGGNSATGTAQDQNGGTPGTAKVIAGNAGTGTGNWTTVGGNVELVTGIGTGNEVGTPGDVIVRGGGTAGTIYWRFSVGGFGGLLPETDDQVDIGSTSKKVQAVYARDFKGAAEVYLRPNMAEPPSTDFATQDERNNRPCLDFDDSTEESTHFTFVMPEAYDGGDLQVTIYWAATSATTGNVKWDISFESVGDGESLTDNVFDTEGSAGAQTVPGTAGLMEVTQFTMAYTDLDAAVAGDLMRLKIARDVATDTATGDAELYAIHLKEVE